jgi:thiamine-monophosphate kinase
MSLSEFGLIARYFANVGVARDEVALGVGDDCLLLQLPADQQLAISVDTLVADVHFPRAADPFRLAQRAFRVTVSDLAAAGAEPVAFTLALTLDRVDETWLDGFSRGLDLDAKAFGMALAGGDTTRGPLPVITLQVMGAVPAGQALTRAGAQPGDIIYVSGELGAARAALEALGKPTPALSGAEQQWLDRYYLPQPRIGLGIALRGIASAAIDISDGFSADLGHILERSDVGAIVDAGALPIAASLRDHPDALSFALAGGDDYELCFTAPPSQRDVIASLSRQLGLALTPVGEIRAEAGLRLRMGDGTVAAVRPSGYQHFE